MLLGGCTSFVPRAVLPPPIANDESGETLRLVTIPLPVVAVSPNEGVTVGGLTAFLFHNRRDELDSLLAPQINENPSFGTTVSLYGAFFPSDSTTIETNLSHSTAVNEDYEIRFQRNPFPRGENETNFFIFRFVDGSSRFFGFGSGSEKWGETNYANDEWGVTASYGWKIGRHYQLQVGERVRHVRIREGAVEGLPFIRTRWSRESLPGIDRFTAHAQRVSLVYSTLDPPQMATFGGYTRISVEGSSRLLGSSADYRHYEVDLRGYVPIGSTRFITAFRVFYNQTLGRAVPFLERSILGGETTLRGYGRNRFVDSSLILFNLEERIRLARWEIFGVNADWEIAPFVDWGGVMERLTTLKKSDLVLTPGIGVRAVVRPNVVGRLDIGFSDEGAAVFVGLGYPF